MNKGQFAFAFGAVLGCFYPLLNLLGFWSLYTVAMIILFFAEKNETDKPK